jgi:RNA polymerase sigma-70 factor (ECF subfamily)
VDSDSQFVARAQGGDQDAFAELFRRHSDPVFRLALSILGQGFAAEAEDVAQEVFLKVHHALRFGAKQNSVPGFTASRSTRR